MKALKHNVEHQQKLLPSYMHSTKETKCLICLSHLKILVACIHVLIIKKTQENFVIENVEKNKKYINTNTKNTKK